VIFGDLSYEQWAGFLLIFVRSAALMSTLPFFSSPNIPVLVKAGLSLALALWLSPVTPLDPERLPGHVLGFGLLCVGEIMIGAIMGLAVRLILTSVQVMGQLIGFQMGFAVANVLDPVNGGQVSVLAQFSFLMATLLLFVVGGHHYFLKALADSFIMVPPGEFSMSQSLFKQMMKLAADMFSLAVRLGAPVIGALLFTQVTMGILAKTVPQMNILMVGFPLTITVGLLFLSVAMLILIPAMGEIFKGLGPMLAGLLKAM
jgi:flagellar biosynthetic protein FliR